MKTKAVTTELLHKKPDAIDTKDLTVQTNTLTPELLHRMNSYWRAANYVSVGQIYLYDNPLLKEPLKLSHVKPLVVGHWGTTPGQNFIYVHLNRVIKKYDLDMFYIAGPGHGGPAIVGNVYLEGTWSEVYPNVTQDEAGLKKLFTQFSFPGGISSHVAPTTPGSIHEGGELGYSVSHAFGAAFDNPGLIVACVVGDGKRKPGLWRPHGSPTSSSTPSPMEPCSPSCTSMATKSHVSGKLTKAHYEHFVPEFERLVREHGRLQVLFDMTAFHGWDAGALWEDIKFDYKHFADIERIAMVGDQMWQQGMAAFCEPFTTAAIRYFDHSHADEARRWLVRGGDQ